MTLEQFSRLYDEEGPFELVNGVRFPVTPPMGFSHDIIMNWIARLIWDFAMPSYVGKSFIKTPFVIVDPDDPNWVTSSRVPDVMYIDAERLEAYKQANPHWEDQPLALVPDWVIEIVSANDRYTGMNAKVDLADGIQLVWVIDPARRAVDVHESGNRQVTTYTGEQTISGGKVLPEFELVVSTFFAE